ncbi:hypothetical protein SNEBB_003776 [Seison nebaliae]|nr:hypothetical protein SNEBB_003776 [Seison nebaliae]
MNNISYIDEESNDSDIPLKDNEKKAFGYLDIQRLVFLQSSFDHVAASASSTNVSAAINRIPKIPNLNNKRKRHVLKDRLALYKPSKQCCGGTLLRMIPIISWMKNYEWKRDLLSDLCSGLTIGIMQIPQGMAYASLAEVDIIYGLYTSFFPVLIYALFASSRHLSQGAFAITSLMTGAAINRILDNNPELGNDELTKIQLAGCLAFFSGLIQIIMFICRFGFISNYMSDPLVRGLTCGTAFHVLTSQIKPLLGLDVKKDAGTFQLPKNWIHFLKSLPKLNTATIVVSLISILILFSIKEGINKPFKLKLKIPIPAELVVVVCGTIAGYFLDVEGFGIHIVGDIPNKLPLPSAPKFSFIQYIIQDAIVVAIISYSVSYSMALLFAERFSYKIDANQELFAQGSATIFGSFFSCFVMGASMSRTAVQVSSGCKTQLTTLISATLVLIVLLVLGPKLRTLPKSCLAAIIVVALKGMIREIVNFPNIWKLNSYEGVVWMVTFLSVLILDVSIGLGIGCFLAIFLIVFQHQTTDMMVMGQVERTELFRNSNKYTNAKELHGIKIVKFENNIFFANVSRFRKTLFNAISLDVENLVLDKKKTNKLHTNIPFSVLIIDCESVNYMDSSCIKMWEKLFSECDELNIHTVLTALKAQPIRMLRRSEFFNRSVCQSLPRFFVSTIDAVHFAQQSMEQTGQSENDPSITQSTTS